MKVRGLLLMLGAVAFLAGLDAALLLLGLPAVTTQRLPQVRPCAGARLRRDRDRPGAGGGSAPADAGAFTLAHVVQDGSHVRVGS